MHFSIVIKGWDQVMTRIRQHKPAWLITRCFLAGALTASLLAGCTAKPEEQKTEEPKTEEQVSLKPTTRSNFLSAASAQNEAREASKTSITNLLNGFSQRVFEAQLGLIRAGISPGSIDGLLGAQTRTAIRAFQDQEEL